jgi:hypothetical protein
VVRERRVVLVVLACAGLAWACEPPPSPATSEVDLGPLDQLARRFGRLRDRMEERGYGPPRRAARHFVMEGRGSVVPVDLAGDGCSTWIALGGGGLQDVTLAVHDGDGVEVGRDDRSGQGALVHVCPGGELGTMSPYYLEIRAGEGNGAVILAEFRSSIGAGEGFEELFEGLVAPAVSLGVVRERLAEEVDALRARGLVPEGGPLFRRMAEGQGWRRDLQLAAGHCYVVTARGGDGIADVDLFMFDAEGAEIARDLGNDASPRLEHCVDRARDVVVELRCFSGAGGVGMVVAKGPPREATREAPTAEAPPVRAMEVELAEYAARLGPLRHLEEDVRIRPGEARSHTVVIGPGCAAWVAVGAPENLDLDLYLSRDGELVDRDVQVRRSGAVAACASEPTPLVLTAKSYGEGRYTLATGAAHHADLVALRSALAVGTTAWLAEETISIVQGETVRVRVPVELAPTRAVLIGGEGVLDVDGFLRAEDDSLVASDTGPAPWAVVERRESGVSLDVVAYRGEGTVVVRWLGPSGS